MSTKVLEIYPGIGYKNRYLNQSYSLLLMLWVLFCIEGHETVISNDGRNAISIIESQKFDAVLLDIAMPGFSGYDVIDKLESMGKLKENKIIILTASSNIENNIDSLKERGVHSVLAKPVDSDLLLQILDP